MVDITHYEVYTDRGTGWKLEERFAEEQHDQAIKYVHDIENDNISVKLIREKFNVMDNSYQETVEYINLANKKGNKGGSGKSSNFFDDARVEKNKRPNTIYDVEEEQRNSPKNVLIAVIKLLVVILFSLLFANVVVTLSTPLLDEMIPEDSVKTLLFLFFFSLFLIVAVPLIVKKVPLQAFGLKWHRRIKPQPEKKFINKADAIFRLYSLNSDVDPDIAPTLPEAKIEDKKKIVEFLGHIISGVDSTISLTDDFNRLGLRFLIYGGSMELARVHKLNIAEANSLLYEAFCVIDGKEADISRFYAARNTYKDTKVAVFLTGVGAYLMSQMLHHDSLDIGILRLTFNKWCNLNNIIYQEEQKAAAQKSKKETTPVINVKEKFYTNVLMNIFLRIMYNGTKEDPKKYPLELKEKVSQMINNLAGKYSGQPYPISGNIMNIQFSSINQALRCAKEIVNDLTEYVEDLSDENLILSERINLIEGKLSDLPSKEEYIDDLFSQAYDGEILIDESINKGADKNIFEIEDLGKKKLEKSNQSVNLYSLHAGNN